MRRKNEMEVESMLEQLGKIEEVLRNIMKARQQCYGKLQDYKKSKVLSQRRNYIICLRSRVLSVKQSLER